jgi:hypothetical protein
MFFLAAPKRTKKLVKNSIRFVRLSMFFLQTLAPLLAMDSLSVAKFISCFAIVFFFHVAMPVFLTISGHGRTSC